METERLYWADQWTRSFDATVRDCREDGIVLDRTLFYPAGGGQPHDTGRISANGQTWSVSAVEQRDEIVHVLDGEGPASGTGITGELDWERRLGHMRHHTAQHLLSAIVLEEFDAQTAGNQLYADRARLDCHHDRLDDEDLATIESRMNELIDEDRAVTASTLARDEAESRMDPARTRLDLLPPSVDPVRIVEIEGVDRTACGGTHVDRTGQIDQIKVTGRETGGSDRERIRFQVVP